MILPAWAVPLTEPEPCECKYGFPAIARVMVTLKRRRPCGWRGAERDYSFKFKYNLCAPCIAYERYLRYEVTYAESEHIAAALIEALLALPPPTVVADEPPPKVKNRVKRKCADCQRRCLMPLDATLCRACVKKEIEVAA